MNREAILDNVASAATTSGLILFGVALGVKWAAVKTAPYFPQEQFGVNQLAVTLTGIYNGLMSTALLAAGACLLVGVLLSMREPLLTTIEGDVERLREASDE